VKVDDQDVAIKGTTDHLRILNSHYFGDPNGFGLSGGQINRLYSLARSRITHNALVGAGCTLAEGTPQRPAIQEVDSIIWIYLPDFWNRCNEAVRRFLAVADEVIPASAVVRELRDKEVSQGINFKLA